MPIAILLATYNGEAYVVEQVRSLQAQTRTDWCLYIGDDGSTDRTPELVARLAGEDPRIVVLTDAVRNRGASARFCWLLEQTRSRHEMFFFCDQDDVWLAGKVARMARVLENEGLSRPVLVHSDLVVVDATLRPLKPSFFAHAGIHPGRHRPDQLAQRNTVTGCASAFTKALADLALPMPAFEDVVSATAKDLVLHDRWLAMVASQCGRIITLPDALVLYRQHGKNSVGMGSPPRRRWHRLSPRFLADRLSREAGRARLRFSLDLLEPRLRRLQERFGGLEKPLSLLASTRRRDLLAFVGKYRLGSQSPVTTLLLVVDILRTPARPRPESPDGPDAGPNDI